MLENTNANVDEDEDEEVMSIEVEPSTGLVGVFMRHQQKLLYFDWSEVGRRNRRASATTSSTISNPSTTVSPNKKKSSITNASSSPRLVHYHLNPSLFAIAEPYFMRTERAALLAYIKNLRSDGQSLVGDAGATTNGTSNPTTDDSIASKPSNNSTKRKRQLSKKIGYIEANLSNPGERYLVARLLQRYLTEQAVLPSTQSGMDVKKLMEHMSTWGQAGDESNREAQAFVASLFNNRFEALNYQTKLFANPFDELIKVKFGLSTYLIPGRCSFAGVDIVDGVRALCRHLKMASVSGDPQTVAGLVGTTKPFMLVIDPAWEKNKSVKRKKAYETVSYDYLERMTTEVKSLLDLVVDLRCETLMKQKAASLTSNDLTVLAAIWTTAGDRDFVVERMLPTLGMRLAYDLKWHKVTTKGLPVKVHGGLEFLLLSEKRVRPVFEQSPVVVVKPKTSGVLVSIPSAIHSHKPSVLELINRLYRDELGSAGMGRRHRTSSVTSSDDHQLFQYDLVPNEFIAPLEGVELFARSLTSGFHSIGLECIKLQNDKLFVAS